MSSLDLQCPLCCNETFPSHDSLKYHLLSIIDNLLCPACGKRFEKIYDLADHLGKKCGSEETTESANSEETEVSVEKQGNSPILEESILARALMQKPNTSDEESTTVGTCKENNGNVEIVFKEEMETDKEKENEGEMFYCSSCMISFSSVNEHLEKFHEGQTVYIEDNQNGEGTETEQQEQDDTAEYVVVKNENLTEDSNDSEEVANDNSVEGNTLQQEECVDNEGRAYTRKVVQIEKFWNNTKKLKRGPPVILQYILENGKARKADDVDINNLPEGQQLLNIYQCTVCSNHFSKLEPYEKHKCIIASTDSHKCSKCDATFGSAKLHAAHMKIHKADKVMLDNQGPYICDTCNTEFPSFKSLRLHRRMHDPIKEKEIEPPVNYGIMGEDIEQTEERELFLCKVCNNTYDRQYETVHMNSHIQEDDFDCRICNRKFFTSVNLEMHMRVHSNGKKFSCSQCKKSLLTYEALQDHVAHQCNTNIKSYECQYCGRRFVRPHEKVKHERIHTGEKPHVCAICGKAFRVSYCLTLHMRTHSGTRPYQCKTCGKRFKAHSVYNHHLLTHSNVRNYKCPYCPKSFKTGVQLAGHKNSHIKPFTCTVCNRPFASLYAVRAHMESHYRENNLKYNCTECGASYARAFALRDHMKAHHPTVNVENNEGGEILQEYEMVTEGISASNSIMQVDESVLVQYETTEEDHVDLVEEVATDC